VRLFHYHLVTSKVRQAEARYLAKLGFELIARYGRIGEEQRAMEPGVAWEELDRIGFKLRLSELQRGAVNVVLQPGHWELPRVDHLGVVLDEDDFAEVLARANARGLKVQEHAGRRTFIATNAGYRLEIHPPREWIDELLSAEDELRLEELQMRADDPAAKAAALRDTLGLQVYDGHVQIGETTVSFIAGGPQGRPELHGERFV
jgi:hypothetical protein